MSTVRLALCLVADEASHLDEVGPCCRSYARAVEHCYVVLAWQGAKTSANRLQLPNVTAVAVDPVTHPSWFMEHEGQGVLYDRGAAWNLAFSLAVGRCDYLLWTRSTERLMDAPSVMSAAAEAAARGSDGAWLAVRSETVVLPSGKLLAVLTAERQRRLLSARAFTWTRGYRLSLSPSNATAQGPSWPCVDRGPVVSVAAVPDSLARLRRARAALGIQVKREGGRASETLLSLAEVTADLGRDAQALELLNQALTRPLSACLRAEAFNLRGVIHRHRGDLEASIRDYRAACAAEPGHGLYGLHLAAALGRTGPADPDPAPGWSEHPPAGGGGAVGPDRPVERGILEAIVGHQAKHRGRDARSCATFERRMHDLYERLLFWAASLPWGHHHRLTRVLRWVPVPLRTHDRARQVHACLHAPRRWGPKDIVYLASRGAPHVERWDGRCVERGIGGSETAVVRLAEAWARRGYQVTVHCDCGRALAHRGVRYRPYWSFNWHDRFSVLILWRSPHLLDLPLRARHLALDLHDLPQPRDWTPARIKRVDTVFFKSRFHRQTLPELPSSKAVVISNGIMPCEGTDSSTPAPTTGGCVSC